MADELSELKAEIAELRQELDALRQRQAAPVSGIAVKTSDLMNGFQSALAKAIQARRSSTQSGENIKDYVIKNLEIEFAAPLVAERDGEEPILMVPNIKNVTTESPLVRLKFSVAHVPPKEAAP